jgi:hypothetical protein
MPGDKQLKGNGIQTFNAFMGGTDPGRQGSSSLLQNSLLNSNFLGRNNNGSSFQEQLQKLNPSLSKNHNQYSYNALNKQRTVESSGNPFPNGSHSNHQKGKLVLNLPEIQSDTRDRTDTPTAFDTNDQNSNCRVQSNITNTIQNLDRGTLTPINYGSMGGPGSFTINPNKHTFTNNKTSGKLMSALNRTNKGERPASKPEFIVAVCENRAREIGFCAFSLFNGSVILTKLNDNSLYQNTISMLTKLLPVEILVLENNHTLMLISKIYDNFPRTTLTPLKSFYFNENRGLKIYNEIVHKEVLSDNLDSKYLC